MLNYLKELHLNECELSQIKATFGMLSLWLYNGIKELYIIKWYLLSLKRTFSPYHTHIITIIGSIYPTIGCAFKSANISENKRYLKWNKIKNRSFE